MDRCVETFGCAIPVFFTIPVTLDLPPARISMIANLSGFDMALITLLMCSVEIFFILFTTIVDHILCFSDMSIS
jgi:hypothetical protein